MSIDTQRIGIFGLGSPHGDDQFGWAVVDELNQCFQMDAQKIGSPVDLVQSLDVFDRLILIDAAVGMADATSFKRLDCSDAADRDLIEAVAGRGTHGFGLHEMLQLAISLGKSIDRVEIWIGKANVFNPLTPMSAETADAVHQCAAAIAREWCNARTIAR